MFLRFYFLSLFILPSAVSTSSSGSVCPCSRTNLLVPKQLHEQNDCCGSRPQTLPSKDGERSSSRRSQANPGIYLFSLAWIEYYDYSSNRTAQEIGFADWLRLTRVPSHSWKGANLPKSQAGERRQPRFSKVFGQKQREMDIGWQSANYTPFTVPLFLGFFNILFHQLLLPHISSQLLPLFELEYLGWDLW